MKTISIKTFKQLIKSTPMFNRYTILIKISLLANKNDEPHLQFILNKSEKMLDDVERLRNGTDNKRVLKNLMVHYITLTEKTNMRSVIKSHYVNFIRNLFNNEIKHGCLFVVDA